MTKKVKELNFYQGSQALAEGAIAAGCKFYAAYPVTPANEISEFMSQRLSEVEGNYLQMEDESASLAACVGASWAGQKAMTTTAGPGFSALLENLGFAVMTETPVVIVNVQRTGPSTGQATRPAQGAMQQPHWGANGDYQIVALSPWSVQEMYDLTIEAFNISEKLRVPVVILTDELVAHLRENAKLKPEPDLVERNKRTGKPVFGTKDDTGIPPMPALGSKQKLLITGTTHDENGFRKDSDPEAAQALITRLSNKVLSRKDEIARFEKDSVDDADIIIISYGFTARSASGAVKLARQKGIKLGLLRLITIWPFPDDIIRSIKKDKKIVVAEMNKGQIAREVERCTGKQPQLLSKVTGLPIEPDEIVEFVEGISK